MTKKKSKPRKNLREDILKFFKRSPKNRLNARQIIKKLHLTENVDAVDARLTQLKDAGKIVQMKNGKYKLNKAFKENKMQEAIGRVDMTRRGTAYVVCDGREDDIFINARNIGSALNNDRVKVLFKEGRGNRTSGKIVEVTQRAADHFIGTMHSSPKFAFVITSDDRMPVDIFIPTNKSMDAKDGEKVIVKIVKWHGKKQRSPQGEVTAVLGAAGSNEIEMKTILLQNGFSLDFPDEVELESKQLEMEITEKELAKRRDFRPVTTFTIDPETAKDFDDALSIQYLDDGICEVGVHIADVTHYVKENSALDKEAYRRATSVYLVDRCLPMLPERISNDLCSLNPQEDKFCFSAVFTFDKDGKLTNRWFGKTIIYSDHRFTYEAAQEVIETGKGPFAKELKKLNNLAGKLRKAKFRKGAINFDSVEVAFKLDETGKPIDVYVKERKDAHLLVEDFMLLANKEVARYLAKKGNGKEVPSVYRVHDLPDTEKVADFAKFAAELGFKVLTDTPKQIAESFNKMVKASKEQEELKLLMPLAIRTMAKAVYTTDNIGHYGLAFDYYSHFTSPIRRYADVLVHRILYKNLGQTTRVDADELEMACTHISNQERKAMDAERESIRFKQAEHLNNSIGEDFMGTISGIHEKGLFVMINDNHCEGMISFDTIGERFELEGRFKAIGQRSGQVFKMGDQIEITVTAVDLDKRRVDMQLVELVSA